MCLVASQGCYGVLPECGFIPMYIVTMTYLQLRWSTIQQCQEMGEKRKKAEMAATEASLQGDTMISQIDMHGLD